jgi:hypothetical protein
VTVRVLLVEDLPQVRGVVMDLLATVGADAAFQKGNDVPAFLGDCQCLAQFRLAG